MRESILNTNKEKLVRPAGQEINDHGHWGCSSVVGSLWKVLASLPAFSGKGRRGRYKLGIIQNRKRNASYHGEMVHPINVRSVNVNKQWFPTLPHHTKIRIIKEERNERGLERIYMCSRREENQKYSSFSVRMSHWIIVCVCPYISSLNCLWWDKLYIKPWCYFKSW